VPAEALKGETRFELASLKGGVLSAARIPGMGFRVIRPDGTEKISAGEETHILETGALSEFLGPQDIAEIDLGAWVFCVRLSQKEAKIKTPIELDKNTKYFFGFSGLIHALALMLFYLVPPDASGFSLDPSNHNNRFMKIMLTPAEILEQMRPQDQTQEKNVAEPGGKAHKGVMGKMGDRHAKKTNNRSAIKGPPDNRDPRMKKEALKEMAHQAGILGILSADKMPVSPFGSDTPLGFDPENALGNLIGDQPGMNLGYGGLGPNGTGRGGGGTGEGTIGVGRLGTISWTLGRGDGKHPRNLGDGKLSGRRSRGPILVSKPAVVKGSLSKETIRRIVHRHINEIKFCYEKGLMKRPDLSGRVSIKFLIAGTGAVKSAAVASSTIGDPGVEICIAQTVERMTFPMPEDGGLVIVTYPFSLSSPDA
jgi:hypothetical protein